MEKHVNVIDWTYQEELNKLCEKYHKEWKKLDDFYLKKRIFAYIDGITTKCKGVHQIYPKVNGIFIFDWKDYPNEKIKFDKKLSRISVQINITQMKMGFHDRSLGN